jgi:hypothetical protein
MCTNGVNAGQLRAAIEQVDEAVALCRRWTHRAYHQASDGVMPNTAAQLKAAQELLDEARAALSEAASAADDEAAAPAAGVTVNLV